MTFGLHSASATFQRVLDPKTSPHTFAYQDEMIVIKRMLEKYKENLREVFRRLKESKLWLNHEKRLFLKKELLNLGHRVTSVGV